VGLYELSKFKYELSKFEYDSYQIFIKNIYDDFMKEYGDNFVDEDNFDLNYFDEIIYTKDKLLVKLPLFSFNGSDGLSGVPDDRIFTLYNTNGFTVGEILYKMTQKIPNAEDLTIFSDLILKYDDPLKILDELENLKSEISNSKIFDDELKIVK
jgi:hypothetical protein